MKEMFIVMVADVHVDYGYDVAFKAKVLPQAYGTYEEAAAAAKKASKEYRDVEILSVDSESNRVYGEDVVVDYVDA